MEKNKMRVYLDYAATAPVKKEVFEVMMPYFTNEFGNPSSIHQFGRQAKKALENSRTKVAKFFGSQPSEIIFTSGATESNNLAILGLINAGLITKPHIITSQIEHHAVLHTCQYLEKQELAEVTYIKPNKEGIIEAQDVRKALKGNTRLVTVMYANNEIGTIQPIREIGKIIEKENSSRPNDRKIYFHTDAVQAVNYLPVNVDYLHVDMLSFSGHKIGAPKGVGGLYVRKGTPLKPQFHGGSQELGLRPGTENIASIVGLAKAIETVKDQPAIIQNRDYFIKKVLIEIPNTYLNGSAEQRLPNNANLYFKHVEGESIVLALDLEGVACSTGSACTSLSLEPSHVIMSTYHDPFRAAGSVRFTIGEKTSKSELNYAVEKIKKVIKRLRDISPYTKEK